VALPHRVQDDGQSYMHRDHSIFPGELRFAIGLNNRVDVVILKGFLCKNSICVFVWVKRSQ
jgi:hypothetical protein